MDGTPTIPNEAIGGKGDKENADKDPAVDNTVLPDEAVLTVNEVEEVLRDAFEEADQLASITNDQEGATSVGDDPTLLMPGSSLHCIGIRCYHVYRGASHNISRVRSGRHNPRSLCRRGSAFSRASDQGNDYLPSESPDLSDPL